MARVSGTSWPFLLADSSDQIIGLRSGTPVVDGYFALSNTETTLNYTQTWNNVGTTFTGIGLAVTDTASAAGSLLMDLQVGGSSKFSVRKDGRLDTTGDAVFGGNLYLTVGSALQLGAGDTILTRDAANTLAQRNGVNAQTFRVYNTYTDASNYERISLNWGTNVAYLFTDAAGTGTQRNFAIGTQGGTLLRFFTNNVIRWDISSAGHFLATTDNTYDIGASGASRPRFIYAANDIVSGANITAGSGSSFSFAGRAITRSPSDGVIGLYNAAASDFGRLQFGGTTASFPSLKRNGTALETKLADDSAYAPHAMQYLDVTDGVTAPAAATGRARIYVDTADGDLKIIFADGTVKTIVTDT